MNFYHLSTLTNCAKFHVAGYGATNVEYKTTEVPYLGIATLIIHIGLLLILSSSSNAAASRAFLQTEAKRHWPESLNENLCLIMIQSREVKLAKDGFYSDLRKNKHKVGDMDVERQWRK